MGACPLRGRGRAPARGQGRSEIARIRAAAELADEALRGVLERGLVGRTEREVAIELELEMRRLGAEGPSFPSIVASGAHGALPHAEPRAEPIARDVLVTIDWGALHEGYCSDCTRTYATGERVSARAREIYELVRCSAGAGAGGRAGRTERARARRRGARGDRAPPATASTSATASATASAWRSTRARACRAPPARIRCCAGNVVTVEPGVYLPGECGVRIEDLVVVRAGGHEVLTGLPKELTVIS